MGTISRRNGGIASENDLRRAVPSDRPENRLLPPQLAERIDRSPAYIGHVEAPNILKAVSLDTLFDIATVLEVPPYKFLLFEDP